MNDIASRIYKMYEEKAKENPLRSHLGASEIGTPCERYLWYQFRCVRKPSFSGKTLRLFETGKREEDRVIDNLNAIGIKVSAFDPKTGRQYMFIDPTNPHFGGSADGIAIIDGIEHILEIKTSNTPQFRQLVKYGLENKKPQHYDQMQMYMMWAGISYGLYVCICKETDEIHSEIILSDLPRAVELAKKADRIIKSQSPPPKTKHIYLCKMCAMRNVCDGNEPIAKNCRTCARSMPVSSGEWLCTRGKFGEICGNYKSVV